MTSITRSVKKAVTVPTGDTVIQLGGNSQGVGILGSRREQYQLVTEGAGGGVTWSLEVLLRASETWRTLETDLVQTDIAVIDLPGVRQFRITFSAGVAEGAQVILYRENK